ncbi:regulator of chromosome condensation 1/beta-lactamase-inhibitor protein II [Dioszegia hungarica]|uniref:Regulator of chromosome condensation 1/beta-lactamase-inhibitor protein II n=1 Tax=Dioszegia hungarica TaxID=4972 RepID=A0AA38LU23_9TREE|nr:regulator of chromosome condensation 1/beta-lactamase-inhibitor protein II [Dioszegia hungarica]KAI9634109.1 regulator of chromosome condensation 1/beta-lactamase-inhibitor protein II [Dioszegia hungarica]
MSQIAGPSASVAVETELAAELLQKISPEEVEAGTGAQEVEQKWGRVLICGGTTWGTNGKKERPADTSTDLLFPHILRSICHIKVVKIITGPAANYAIALDIHGIAILFGRLPSSHFAPGNGYISEQIPRKLSPRTLGMGREVKWISGAAARSHMMLLASDGSVWGCGNNVFGQLGLPVTPEVPKWTRITGPWSKQPDVKIVQVTAGHSFSLFLTSTGQIYAAGSSECGQVGSGKTGERLLKGGKIGFDVESPARLVSGLSGKKIVQIASGNQHSLALDDEGYVYAWGFAGYSRLGLQDQKDRMVPTVVPSFTGKNELSRGASVVCGPTNSVVIDRQGVYYMAGKWKNTGDGSHGAPYTSFKPIHDIMGCKVIKASSGGCTHFLTTPDPDGGTMTVGFGQGCLYGELGLGAEVGKSSTKPTKLEGLIGIDVIDIAAGAFCTLFLAHPNAALTEISRWPVHVRTPDICIVCKIKTGDPLECERCDMPYHLGCLNPPLSELPEGEWFCPKCQEDMERNPADDVALLEAANVLAAAAMNRRVQAEASKAKAKAAAPKAKRSTATRMRTASASASAKGSNSPKSAKGSPGGKRKAEEQGGRPKSRLQHEMGEDEMEDDDDYGDLYE